MSAPLLRNASSDPDPLITHSYSESTRVDVEIVSAFAKIGVDVSETNDVLSDFINPDGLANYLNSPTPVSVTARLWGHPVLIEPGMIYIFEKEG